MNKESITYCVEFRRSDESKYTKSFNGFRNKNIAMMSAESATDNLHARVVEQRRRIIKVFKKKTD